MPIYSKKSVFDPIERRKDGMRIVATRYWPRGMKTEVRDLYLPDLAPSKDLLRDFRSSEMTWREFAKRYRTEMQAQRSLIRTLHWLSESGDALTVMCTCSNQERCHRKILAGLIEQGG
jgi:uncharacterized protein YeaO (DUF488 family)